MLSTLTRASPAIAVALCLTATAAAQHFPVKPLRIVVPVAPGGGLDPQARLLGTELVVRSPADGYTLLCAASTLASTVTLNKKLSFDIVRDLTPVSQISSTAQFLVVLSTLPAASIQDFIALARRQSGKMNAASGGTGSANHFALEMFKLRTGIQATHIPYKGSGPATIALMSGEVDFSFAGALTSLPHIRAGKIKALAVTTPKPSASLPLVPTLTSLYPGFESTNWYAIFAPSATPAAIIHKISSEIANAIKAPDAREFMAKEGAEPVGSTPAEAAAFFKVEVERHAKVIQAANIRLD